MHRNVLVLLLFAAPTLDACGILPGGAAIPNDPVPQGTVIGSGVLNPLNGKTCGGFASVYRLATDSSFVVRLEGLVVPAENTLHVVAYSNTQVSLDASLRSTKGTQNYPTGLADGRTWTSIYIRQPANSLIKDYCKADLVTP